MPPATKEALVELSKKMNAKLQDPAIFPDPQARDWCVPPHSAALPSRTCTRTRASIRVRRFKLFRHMDDDKSGKVSYVEFSGLCREELKMKKKDVPDLELQGAWNALDDDDSGLITAAEFGPFMKSGAPPRV